MSFKAITQLHQFPLLLHSQQVELHSERAVVPDVFEIFHLLGNQVDRAEPFLSSVAEQRQRGRDCGMLCEFTTVCIQGWGYEGVTPWEPQVTML